MKKFISALFYILTPKEQARLFIMAAADLLMGIADVAFLFILILMIKAYAGGGPVIMMWPYNQIVQNNNPVIITGVLLLLFCIKNLAGIWVSKKQHQFVYGVASRLSEENMLSYLRGSYLRFIDEDSSVQVRQISQVPIEFGHYILTNFQQIIAQLILIMFTIGAILLYHPVLFILLFFFLLPPVIALGLYLKNQLKKIRSQIKINSVKAIQYLQESLSGYVESNIYDKKDFFTNRYLVHQQQLNQNIATQQTLQSVSSRFIEMFALLGFFILVVINKLFGGKHSIDTLTIGIFMAAAYKIIPGIVKIMNSAAQIKTYSFTLPQLAENQINPTLLMKKEGNGQHISAIRFSDVCFKFKEKQIFNVLSFELKKGDFAGISGISGRGKTTMVNLLLGFLEQDSGDISINQQPANAGERAGFWSKIAYVKQQSFFINDTILKNITLANEGLSAPRLQQALNITGLDIFLNEYPEGIEKMIHEQGKNISGGQRQRIALARAIYNAFDVLILDEPFSEMDEAAAQEILLRLQQLTGNGSIVLFITHNKQSLTYCNKIILADAA